MSMRFLVVDDGSKDNTVAESAKRAAQYYINQRWLGGTLTNWQTISNSIKRLRKLEELLGGEAQGFTKREQLTLTRERDKLDRALGGIKDMGGTPDIMFVIDTNKEELANVFFDDVTMNTNQYVNTSIFPSNSRYVKGSGANFIESTPYNLSNTRSNLDRSANNSGSFSLLVSSIIDIPSIF